MQLRTFSGNASSIVDLWLCSLFARSSKSQATSVSRPWYSLMPACWVAAVSTTMPHSWVSRWVHFALALWRQSYALASRNRPHPSSTCTPAAVNGGHDWPGLHAVYQLITALGGARAVGRYMDPFTTIDCQTLQQHPALFNDAAAWH